MRPAAIAFAVAGFLVSAAAAAVVANYAVNELEQTTERLTKSALVASGQAWAEVKADGTMVMLSGTAPDEKKRLRALDAITTVVSSSRVINRTDVAESVPVVAPDFALEILRNGKDVSLIGITPDIGADDPIHTAIASIADVSLIDMHEPTKWTAPDGWITALDFGGRVMAEMERAKISIQPGTVSVTAVVTTDAEKTALTKMLLRQRPESVVLTMDITAPRPIFSPYSLTFTMDADGARLKCQTLTLDGAKTILAAAREKGVPITAGCDIGLGAPTDNWADIAVAGFTAVAEMGGGELAMQDSGITLISPEDFDADRFAAIADTFQATLPDAYILHRVLTKKPVPDDVVNRPWFSARRTTDGGIILRGVIVDDISRQTLIAYADAGFGYGKTTDKTEIADFAPHGWTARQLVALDVLDLLDTGQVAVTEEAVTVTGKGTLDNLKSEIKTRLEKGFGADARFAINVEQVAPDPVVTAPPDPKVCESDIAALLAKNRILFAPSSAMIEPDSEPTITAIAKILNRCRDAWFEIGGHTDSKGSELLNKNLSQSRADAVLDALLARNLLFGDLTAVGYGESQPIADNATEEGRQKNRRIEFKLREGTPEQAAANAEAARTAAEQAAADLAAARPATPLRRPSDLKIITVDIPQNPTSEATNGQN